MFQIVSTYKKYLLHRIVDGLIMFFKKQMKCVCINVYQCSAAFDMIMIYNICSFLKTKGLVGWVDYAGMAALHGMHDHKRGKTL